MAPTAATASKGLRAVAAAPAQATETVSRFNPAAITLLIGGGLTIYLILTGRIDRFLAAMRGQDASTAQGWSIPGAKSGYVPPSTGTYTQGHAPKGYSPLASLFGLSGGRAPYDAVTQHYSDYVVNADQAGLSYAGGGQLADDWDYPTADGTPVKLPSGTRWTLVKQYFDSGAGYIQAWTPADNPGPIMEFVHLSNVSATEGQTVGGGQTVGYSGHPLSPANGQGSHLSVIVDTAMAGFLYQLEHIGGT